MKLYINNVSYIKFIRILNQSILSHNTLFICIREKEKEKKRNIK